AEGLLLVNHGHFTWGPWAKASYDRLISHTNEVEAWLAQRRPGPLYPGAALPLPRLADTLAGLRGALASCLPEAAGLPVLDLRADDAIRAFTLRDDLAALATRGVATPDHVIRTKGHPLVLTRETLAGGPEALRQAVTSFAADYAAYFDRQAPQAATPKTMLS